MKHLIIIIALLLVGCVKSSNKVKVKHASEQEMFGGHTYTIVTIDSCEYISWVLGTDRGVLTHKGNCKNCKK